MKQQQRPGAGPWMGVNSLCRSTVALKMNLSKTAKRSSKLLPKISAGTTIPLQESQWLCLSSLLHSVWKRPRCRVQYPRFTYASQGDVFYHKLPNSAQSKATATVAGVQMQLLFDFNAPCRRTGAESGSHHASLLLLPRRQQAGQRQAALAGR